MTQNPISVTALLPVRNGMKYIHTARDQIQKACREIDEILIVDDNSTDGTIQELNKWAKADSRVRVIRNEGDGLVSALNLGLKESSKSWIARFDIDDKYKSNRLQEQIASINADTVAIFSDYEIFRPNGISLGKIPSPIDSDAVKISLVRSRRTPHPSVLFFKEAVLSVGGYRTEDFPAEDLSLWLRLSRVGKLVSVPEVLLDYRLGMNSISGQQRSKIIERSTALLRDIGIQDSTIHSGFERLDEILSTYSGLNLEKERQFLFLQELSKVMEISGNQKKFIILGKFMSKFDMSMVGATINMTFNTARRRAYRKFG